MNRINENSKIKRALPAISSMEQTFKPTYFSETMIFKMEDRLQHEKPFYEEFIELWVVSERRNRKENKNHSRTYIGQFIDEKSINMVRPKYERSKIMKDSEGEKNLMHVSDVGSKTKSFPKDMCDEDLIIDLIISIFMDADLFDHNCSDEMLNQTIQFVKKMEMALYIYFKTLNEGLLNFDNPENFSQNSISLLFTQQQYLILH